MSPRPAFLLATFAVLAAAAFTGWAWSSDPLAAERETTVRVAVTLPLVLTCAAWLCLHAACTRGSSAMWLAGTTMAWTLLAFAVVTGFSIGMLVAPAALALVLAASATPVATRA